MGFAECSKSSAERFELWDETRNDGYAIQTLDSDIRQKWIQRLTCLTTLYAQQQHHFVPEKNLNNQWSQQRPQSWTSESSTVSSTRSITSAIEDSTQIFQQTNFPLIER